MQKAYITALYDLMEKDSRVVSLLSDSGTEYDIMMAGTFPSQCFNFGIAEQNKVAAASGMAAVGKIPYVYTTGAFIAYRAYEFVRNDICFQNRNVKLVGMGMGFSGLSTLGASHHTTEDIAALRAIPNLTLLCAATPIELQRCVQAAYEINGPVYIRMGMSGEKEFYDEAYRFQVGELSKWMDGEEIVLFTTGTIAGEVHEAALLLEQDKISVSLYNVPTLKPLNKEAVIKAIQNKKYVFTIEEHSVYGGLGGLIAEILAEKAISIPLVRIGLEDVFAKGYGTGGDLRRLNGFSGEQLYHRIQHEVLLDSKNVVSNGKEI